jgi:hypothetical protein
MVSAQMQVTQEKWQDWEKTLREEIAPKRLFRVECG